MSYNSQRLSASCRSTGCVPPNDAKQSIKICRCNQLVRCIPACQRSATLRKSGRHATHILPDWRINHQKRRLRTTLTIFPSDLYFCVQTIHKDHRRTTRRIQNTFADMLSERITAYWLGTSVFRCCTPVDDGKSAVQTLSCGVGQRVRRRRWLGKNAALWQQTGLYVDG